MVKYDKSVFINRPPGEVFDFVANPSNDPKWQSTIESAERTSHGPIGVGSTWRYVTNFLGRKIAADVEIMSYDPPRKASFKAISGPIPYQSTYKVEPKDNGTDLSVRGEAEFEGLFKLGEGFVDNQLEKQVEADLLALKLMLEGEELKES